jgi:hypothetical protein
LPKSQKLSFAERQELVRAAIAIEGDEVTPEANVVLDQRLADFRRDPTSGVAADDSKRSVLKRIENR